MRRRTVSAAPGNHLNLAPIHPVAEAIEHEAAVNDAAECRGAVVTAMTVQCDHGEAVLKGRDQAAAPFRVDRMGLAEDLVGVEAYAWR